MIKYNRSLQYAHSMKRISNMVFLAGMTLLLSASMASAMYTIQEFGTDGFRYLNGTNITVSGKLMNDTAGEPDANITLLYNSSGTLLDSFSTTTDSNGAFSQVIPTNLSGRYSIVAMASDFNIVSPPVDVLVYGEDAIKSIVASFTRGRVYAIALNDTGYGNTSINDTLYYFFVSSSNTVSVDNDADINTTETESDGFSAVGNIVTNSRVKLGNDTYSVFFVNRTSEIVLARMVQPVFTSEGYRNLTLLALNASNYPLSGKNLSLIISNSSGVINSSDLTSTDAAGMTTSNISIMDISGIYTVQILENSEPLGTITYSVNSYDVAGDVLSPELTSQRTFARGQNATLAVSVKTSAGAIINNSQANVSANVRGPGGSLQQYNLSFDTNNSLFYYVYSIPDSAAQGTYTVEYITTISNQTLKSYSSFEVRGYSLFLKPISDKVAELEGFFPGEQGYILVSGTDLGTGDTANINILTGSSNRSNFTFSIKNSAGTDVTGAWGAMSLDDFFNAKNVEPWLEDEIRARASNASVINFTAPNKEGIYDTRITVKLNGTTEEASTSLGIQSIFLYAFPVSSDGSPAMSVSSQENVTLRIEAFNPKTMRPETNITAAGIVEAFAVDAAEIVTEKMLNPSLFALPDGSKGLRFYNNDSNMGFHMVKFWANVTTDDGNTAQAMGTGFFDARQYLIWATPSLTNSGNFMTFTAGSDISLRVQVMNTGFSPQSGKQVTVDEVRYSHTWEKVDFDTTTSANISATTDDNGMANLSFTPSSSLKSGWYDVRIKLTATDASGNYVTDYGRGWFEVRNFMFWAYPENWNVKAGENITFRVQAVNSTNMSSPLNATVRVKKVMLRTDWMQPPIEVTGNHTLNGSTSVDISTSMGQSASISYTGGRTTRSGMYEFILEAASGSAIEEARAMVESRPFVAWVSLPGGMWNNRFGVNNTVNLIVHASDSYGGGTPIQLDANRTNITSVTKMGMFGGSRYKTQSQLNITSVTNYTGNTNDINITLSLTDWQEGSYDMLINAVDSNGNEVVTHFWMEVEVATVGLPQFYTMWLPEGKGFTNRASFYLTDTPSEKVDNPDYPGLDNDVASNFSNSKIGNNKSFLQQEWGVPPQREFWALVNLTEPRKLYVNYNDSNFSDTSTSYAQNMTVGEIFNERDSTGNIIRHWNVTSISSEGTVTLEGIDALVSGYTVDPSMSRSGMFITAPDMRDNEWLKVDLDGNGEYQGDWNPQGRNNTYYILLADNATAGVYDTVWVSNTTDFTRDGINASSGAPVAFGGSPIYFISLKKEGSEYIVQFTSYTTGWGGMWLGTFEKGRTLKIPFLVQEPGTTTGISGARVEVDKLTWHGPGSDRPVVGANATTNSYGLAVVNLSTENIPTGEYLISYRVTNLPGGGEKSATEKWRMPGVEIRKFVVSAEFGNVGTISTHKITNGSGLTVMYGTEIEPRGAVSAYQWGLSNIYRVGWPFDQENEYYYNTSDSRYYTGFDWSGGGHTTGSPIDNSSINLTRDGANTTYNFTRLYESGTSITLNGSQVQNVFDYWNISIWGGVRNEGGDLYVRLKIDYLLDDQLILAENPPFNQPQYRMGDRIYWGPGELNIQITDIDQINNTVSFTLFQPKILYQSESLGILLDDNESNGEWQAGRVTKLSYNGYDVYGYNDRNYTTLESPTFRDTGWGWSPTLDHVLVKNSTWNSTYRIGEIIPQLNNEYVGLVANWGGKIIFVNDSAGMYPFSDWAPDGNIYYVGTFTEDDVNVDLNYNSTTSDNNTYYIRLEDNSPNGVFNVTSGIYDDDPDFTQGQGMNASQGISFRPLDLYSTEQGQEVGWNMWFDERWLSIGSMHGWPFGVPEITYSGNYATLTTFSPRWEPFGVNENITMYVNARSFSNEPINGNISLDKLIVLFKFNQSEGGGKPVPAGEPRISGFEGDGGSGGGGGGEGGPRGPGGAPEVYSNLSVTVPITNGIGMWSINYSVIQPVVGSFDSGNFVARLNISDADGNFEIVERPFFMQNRTAFGKNEYGCTSNSPCGGPGPAPGGGDSGGEPGITPPPGNGTLPPGNETPPPGNGTSPPGNETPPPGNGTLPPGTPGEMWNKTFGGTGYDNAYSVQKTTDEGYIIAGEGFNAGNFASSNALLIKTDANGSEQWNRAFGGAGDDRAEELSKTPDGYVLAGGTASYGAGSDDAWLIKTDANGSEQWNRTFGGAGNDSAYSVNKTSDGYVLAGVTDSYGNYASSNAWLIKTDANGNEQWNRTFGGAGNDSGYSVQKTPDGGYILAGSTTSYGAGSDDAWLIKTDADGNEQWNRTFGGIASDRAEEVLKLSEGYILAGRTSSSGAGSDDAWLIRVYDNGTKQWDRTIGGAGSDSAYSVKQIQDGYVLAGGTGSYGAGGSDAWLVKVITGDS